MSAEYRHDFMAAIVDNPRIPTLLNVQSRFTGVPNGTRYPVVAESVEEGPVKDNACSSYIGYLWLCLFFLIVGIAVVVITGVIFIISLCLLLLLSSIVVLVVVVMYFVI